MKLTNSQKEAIKTLKGNYLVNSTAGSGKTQVFAMRIANLILKENVSPDRILGLTFTKLAAENMRSRVSKFVSTNKASKVNLYTFHSFARKMLLEHFPKDYIGKEIPKDWWKMQIANEICAEGDYRNQIGLNLGIKAGDFLTFVSYQKANMIRKNDDIVLDSKMAKVKEVGRSKLQKGFNKYCELSENANIMDFDDMLLEFYYKLLLDSDFQKMVSQSYDFVMVDEFQDTSKISMEILNLICNDNLFVVGDFRQSIYGFNNAEIDNILDFHVVYPNAKLIELKDNFRSTKQIVDICNKVIDSSKEERYKEFSSALCGKDIDGCPVSLDICNTDSIEQYNIVNKIIELKESSNLSLSSFAILCRTNAELALYEAALSEKDIPAKLSKNGSFFDRKEIADLLAYCYHALNRDDDMSFRRIVNVPKRFIGKNGVYVIDEFARKNNMSFEDAILQIDDAPYKNKFIGVIGLFNTLDDHITERPDKFIEFLLHTIRYRDYIEKESKSSIDLENRKESIDTLLSIAKKYPTLSAFLYNVERIKNNSNDSNVDAVNVMTIHASKGLEYPVVFVTGVTDANFPHSMSTSYEEERRLLYVALSRAINELHISLAINNKSKKEELNPSIFLLDIFGSELKQKTDTVRFGAKMASIS